MARARDAGMARADMISMVTDVFDPQEASGSSPLPPTKETEPAPPADVVYDELPDGLIDLPSACREHGVNIQTANGWMRKGQIPRLGKLKAPGKGGANVTSAIEFKRMASRPLNHGGRPKKTA